MKIAFLIYNAELLAIWVESAECRLDTDVECDWEEVGDNAPDFERALACWLSDDDDHSSMQFDSLHEALDHAVEHFPGRASKLLAELL